MERFGIIGGGAMGTAIIHGVLHNGILTPEQIGVVETNPERAGELHRKLGVNIIGSITELARNYPLLLLAVKPQNIGSVLKALAPVAGSDHLILSIVAGMTTQTLEQSLPATRVIRVMPNTPARLSRGISAYAAGINASSLDCQTAEAILRAVGKVVKVAESQMDAVTATSGSGPAYVFRFAEAMIDAAVLLGIDHATARLLVAETLAGAAEMLCRTEDEPATLRHQVTSPGGTTAAALSELEQGAFTGVVLRAMIAAARRSQELGNSLEKKI